MLKFELGENQSFSIQNDQDSYTNDPVSTELKDSTHHPSGDDYLTVVTFSNVETSRV